MVLDLAYHTGAARNESNWLNKEFDPCSPRPKAISTSSGGAR
jgi:hypothetical protein